MIRECVIVKARRLGAARRPRWIDNGSWGAAIAVSIHLPPQRDATHLQRIHRVGRVHVRTLSAVLLRLEELNVLHHALFDLMRHQVGHLTHGWGTHETMRGLASSAVSDQRHWRHLLHARGPWRPLQLRLWWKGGRGMRLNFVYKAGARDKHKEAEYTHQLQLTLNLGVELSVTGATTLALIAIDGGLQFRRIAQVLLLAFVRVQVLHVPGRRRRRRKKEKLIKTQTLCKTGMNIKNTIKMKENFMTVPRYIPSRGIFYWMRRGWWCFGWLATGCTKKSCDSANESL